MAMAFYSGYPAPELGADSRQIGLEHTFTQKENRCKRIFEWALTQYGGVWHLYTSGKGQQVIFRTKAHYVFVMNLAARCACDCPDIQIVSFEIMSNHVHFIICGDEDKVLAFFELFRRRLMRYFSETGEKTDFSQFKCRKLIPIETLESMRNQICYTNRNNFVADPNQTPFSYPYGANGYYFHTGMKQRVDSRFGDLGIKQKRELMHSRETDYPDESIIVDGYISPVNYCRLDIGEGVFRDARHYFHKLSKNVESYKDIAAIVGDAIFYTDDELSDVLFTICREKYGDRRISVLNKDEKVAIAKDLHYGYNADNSQIARMLKLDLEIVRQLFPLRKD